MTPKPAPTERRRAKLFWNGRSQAVRLPKDFRFDGDEVEIHREGDAVILRPVERERFPKSYWAELDVLAEGLELADAEPVAGAFLDVDVDEG